MNSVEFKGRPDCIYDSWCHVGCPIGALANPQLTYLGEAWTAGADVRELSTVTRILTDASGKKGPASTVPRLTEKFDVVDDTNDSIAVQARVLSQQMRGIARQAALDPGDGLGL